MWWWIEKERGECMSKETLHGFVLSLLRWDGIKGEMEIVNGNSGVAATTSSSSAAAAANNRRRWYGWMSRWWHRSAPKPKSLLPNQWKSQIPLLSFAFTQNWKESSFTRGFGVYTSPFMLSLIWFRSTFLSYKLFEANKEEVGFFLFCFYDVN